MTRLSKGSQWLVRQLAQRCGESEEEIERALLVLIARGHLRVLPGDGPGGSDRFEIITEERLPRHRGSLQ